MKNTIWFAAVLFAAITLAALLAHLLEMRVKMGLSKADYQVVQGIYSGWQWPGFFELGAILLTIAWTVIDQKSTPAFALLLAAVGCFVLGILVFFGFTFPANQATANWTTLPSNWDELRQRWEFSHALRAVLSLVGFSCLMLALLSPARTGQRYGG